MHSVEIVTIGTELLLGAIVDGNSAHIAAALAGIGLDVYAKHSVGDNEERLAATLIAALERSHGVITTGGLGPTVDDITKEAISRALGVELALHEPSLQALTERMARSGRTVSENNRRQAVLPANAFVLKNEHGTAPGFIAFRSDGRFIASMPGVPREMRAMLATTLIPWLREHFHLLGGIFTRTLHTAGIAESDVDRAIEDLFRSQENPKIAMLATGGRVDIKLMAKVANEQAAAEIIAPLEAIIRTRIPDGIFGVDSDTLESVVVDRFRAAGLTLGCAESCTGGALSEAIVRVPGASAAKEALLGVSSQLLQEHGAVSEACAMAMASGALERFGVDLAISTTGIAGPEGGTLAKPVGTVYIGIASRRNGAHAVRYTFGGDRNDIRTRTVLTALVKLLEQSDILHDGALKRAMRDV